MRLKEAVHPATIQEGSERPVTSPEQESREAKEKLLRLAIDCALGYTQTAKELHDYVKDHQLTIDPTKVMDLLQQIEGDRLQWGNGLFDSIVPLLPKGKLPWDQTPAPSTDDPDAPTPSVP